jgi:uncharacterized protein (UPF0548 family)
VEYTLSVKVSVRTYPDGCALAEIEGPGWLNLFQVSTRLGWGQGPREMCLEAIEEALCQWQEEQEDDGVQGGSHEPIIVIFPNK